jgi:hypothetical protein
MQRLVEFVEYHVGIDEGATISKTGRFLSQLPESLSRLSGHWSA